jgi:hypothetical protein
MSKSSEREGLTYTIHSSPLPFQRTVDASGKPALSKVFKIIPAGEPNPEIIRIIGERHLTRPLLMDKIDGDDDTDDVRILEIGATGRDVDTMERIHETARDIVRVLNAFDDPGYVSVLYPNTPPENQS